VYVVFCGDVHINAVHMMTACRMMIRHLQQFWQVGAATQYDFILGGAL
jgi:hypothetical protein